MNEIEVILEDENRFSVVRKNSTFKPVIKIGGVLVEATSRKTQYYIEDKDEAIKNAVSLLQASQSMYTVRGVRCSDLDERGVRVWKWALIIRDYNLSNYIEKETKPIEFDQYMVGLYGIDYIGDNNRRRFNYNEFKRCWKDAQENV